MQARTLLWPACLAICSLGNAGTASRYAFAPRQADFAVTQKDLDFSHMRDHMRRILAGQSRLFSLGSDNAVVQLVSRGAPRVLESQVRKLVHFLVNLQNQIISKVPLVKAKNAFAQHVKANFPKLLALLRNVLCHSKSFVGLRYLDTLSTHRLRPCVPAAPRSSVVWHVAHGFCVVSSTSTQHPPPTRSAAFAGLGLHQRACPLVRASRWN